MGELYDMDIKGRPLAYTPFCDNNREMDGYRFWRQVNINLLFLVEVTGFLALTFSITWNRVSGENIYVVGHTISGRRTNSTLTSIIHCFSHS